MLFGALILHLNAPRNAFVSRSNCVRVARLLGLLALVQSCAFEGESSVDAPLSGEDVEILRHFEELAFHQEEGGRGGGGVKWTQDTIQYAVTFSANEEYLQYVRALFSEAERLTGKKFEDHSSAYGVRNWQQIDIIINNTADWATVDEQFSLQLRLMSGRSEVDFSIADFPGDHARCVGLIRSKPGESADLQVKEKAVFFIGWDDMSEFGAPQRACFNSSFFKSLGFESIAESHESLTGKDKQTSMLSLYDQMAIRLLYSDDVQSGAKKKTQLDEARTALSKLQSR